MHSVRTRQDAAFSDEFEQFAGQGKLDYRMWITIEAGRLTDEDNVGVVGQHPEGRFVLCGPKQIYIENNWPEDAMAERLAMIVPGHDFQPTERELAYAAKLAWRNANKCIGRLYWTGLIVRDCRNVRHATEVLDQMVEHLDLATNGGRLRSCITVLGELGADSATVISPQLVRYAGHKQPDGSIVGDSSNVELTEIAVSRGWRGLGTPFDLLPLVVRDGAGEYHIRELEAERSLEVPLSHPEFKWFSELGLRWHALPAVTNNYLDAFGKIYPVLFNGFYMGTEIGARNFCDPHRYNILPRVAQKMGLDTSSEGTLWRIVPWSRSTSLSCTRQASRCDDLGPPSGVERIVRVHRSGTRRRPAGKRGMDLGCAAHFRVIDAAVPRQLPERAAQALPHRNGGPRGASACDGARDALNSRES